MKKTALLALLLMAGCEQEFLGPVETEPGTVEDTVFMPKNHGSAFNVSTWESTSISIPEKYAVVFKCQHGKFVIEDDRAKILYDKLSRDDAVQILFQRRLRVEQGSTNTNIVGFHFVDANRAEK